HPHERAAVERRGRQEPLATAGLVDRRPDDVGGQRVEHFLERRCGAHEPERAFDVAPEVRYLIVRHHVGVAAVIRPPRGGRLGGEPGVSESFARLACGYEGFEVHSVSSTWISSERTRPPRMRERAASRLTPRVPVGLWT